MKGGIGIAQRHDSALKHVTGQAVYIDDPDQHSIEIACY